MAGRKVLGSFIVILIGLPILFGIIWAVGLVRATVSSNFLSDVPQKIISDIPSSLDGIFAAAKDEKIHMDPRTRAWFQAAEKTGIPPRELLEKTGILAWMKGGLSESLSRIGEVLRGEALIRGVTIDMRPFKAALMHPEMDRFLGGLIDNLPACDEQGLKEWQDRIAGSSGWGDLPPCRPVEAEAAKAVVLSRRAHEVEKIEDTVEVFEDVHPFPFERFGIAKGVAMMSYFLFLIPAVFILLGVWIANRTSAGRLRWMGISIVAGSVPVFLMAYVLKRFGAWASDGRWLSWRWNWSTDFDAVVLDKLGWIPGRIFDALFSPVFGTAAVVALIGVVLVALSYSIRPAAQPQPPLPQPPAVKS